MLGRALMYKFPSQRYTIKGDGELNTLISDEMVVDQKNNIIKALNGPLEWMKEMEDEVNSMVKNYVWTLINLPRGHRAIRVK